MGRLDPPPPPPGNRRVKELESLISTDSEECSLQEYNKCKQDLEEIYNYITEGIILRSKTDWYELGKKSTKYFLNLEERNKAKSHIRICSLKAPMKLLTPRPYFQN